ncbi:hypothetical protein VYU27_002472 [Nannochloropsis oceanica]
MADDAIPSPPPAPAAAPSDKTGKATAVISFSPSWEDQEVSIPDMSAWLAKLSLTEKEASKDQEQEQFDDRDKRSDIRTAAPSTPPLVPPFIPRASKTKTRQRPKPEPPGRAPVTPVQRSKPSQQPSQATPSPNLSRYGADLGDIRDVVRDLPPEDILAHGLYLWGFPPSSSSTTEREVLVSPWTDVGALITWLPPHDACAVAMFYSIPVANRALRQVHAPTGVTAQSLKRAAASVQQQALAAGLAIPPRPKGDTAVPSRLILGALGIRSPSSTRPAIGSVSVGGVRRSSRIREQQEAAAAGTRKLEEGNGGGSCSQGEG